MQILTWISDYELLRLFWAIIATGIITWGIALITLYRPTLSALSRAENKARVWELKAQQYREALEERLDSQLRINTALERLTLSTAKLAEQMGEFENGKH